VCLLGGNASGKSTTMKTILGLVHPFRGEIHFQGQSIQRRTPAQVVRAGIAPVLESRRIFPELTVYENLLMGAYTRRTGPPSAATSRRSTTGSPPAGAAQPAGGTLSGGEQQMLAIARALLARPSCSSWTSRPWPLALFVEKTFEIIQVCTRRHRHPARGAERQLAWRSRPRLRAADGPDRPGGHCPEPGESPVMRKAYLEL